MDKQKKNSSYAWISLILALFFWVPLLNLLILPLSIYFGVKAIKRVKKDPKKYGGFAIAVFSVIWASISLIFSIIFFVLDALGKI